MPVFHLLEDTVLSVHAKIPFMNSGITVENNSPLKASNKPESPGILNWAFGAIGCFIFFSLFSEDPLLTISLMFVYLVVWGGRVGVSLYQELRFSRHRSFLFLHLFLVVLLVALLLSSVFIYKTNYLITAVRCQHSLSVRILLLCRANPNARDQFGNTLLMWAAYKGDSSTLQLLLEDGAEVNAKGSNGSTALMWAAVKGNALIIRHLLAKGAEVNVKNDSGVTALQEALSKQHTEVAELLKQAGAQP